MFKFVHILHILFKNKSYHITQNNTKNDTNNVGDNVDAFETLIVDDVDDVYGKLVDECKGDSDGDNVGLIVGGCNGEFDGNLVGGIVGCCDGAFDGAFEGDSVCHEGGSVLLYQKQCGFIP